MRKALVCFSILALALAFVACKSDSPTEPDVAHKWSCKVRVLDGNTLRPVTGAIVNIDGVNGDATEMACDSFGETRIASIYQSSEPSLMFIRVRHRNEFGTQIYDDFGAQVGFSRAWDPREGKEIWLGIVYMVKKV